MPELVDVVGFGAAEGTGRHELGKIALELVGPVPVDWRWGEAPYAGFGTRCFAHLVQAAL